MTKCQTLHHSGESGLRQPYTNVNMATAIYMLLQERVSLNSMILASEGTCISVCELGGGGVAGFKDRKN